MHKHTLKIHTMEKLVEDEKSVMKHFRTKDLKTTFTPVSFSINFLISINISHRPSLGVTVLKNKPSITYIIQDGEYKPWSIQRGVERPESWFLSPIVVKNTLKGLWKLYQSSINLSSYPSHACEYLTPEPRFFKLLRSQRIDSQEPILLGCVNRRHFFFFWKKK